MNAFKRALADGRPQIGMWQALATPYTAEICAGAGFDWLLFDAEHAPNDLPLLLAQLQAVAGSPIEPVIRPPVGDPVLIKQVLDIGARTLLVPMVESRSQAEQVVRATRYPPHGIRGVGSAIGRASRWNRTADYLNKAAADICVLVQVESQTAVDNIADIATVEGVDGIFVGLSDLAASMGHLGEPGHPDVTRTIDRAIGSILAAGKAAGILSADESFARLCLMKGATFVAVGTDVSILARGAEALARRFVAPTHEAAPQGSVY